jgi:hypothetical protein
MQTQNDLSEVARPAPQKPSARQPTDALGKLIDEKSANQFQGKLDKDIDHMRNDGADWPI